MSQFSKDMLDTGNTFPIIEIKKVGGGTLSVPGEFGGGWGVMLFYRGHW